MSDIAEPSGPAKGSRVLTAAAVYFVIVFAVGLMLGPVRVLWIEPWLGPLLAILCEAPLLTIAMIVAARIAPALAGLGAGWGARLIMGVLALVMQQMADLAVGFGLRGVTLQEQLAYFRTLPGYIYIIMLVLFALMPLIVYWRSASTRETPTS
jgi:hypothetical protein